MKVNELYTRQKFWNRKRYHLITTYNHLTVGVVTKYLVEKGYKVRVEFILGHKAGDTVLKIHFLGNVKFDLFICLSEEGGIIDTNFDNLGWCLYSHKYKKIISQRGLSYLREKVSLFGLSIESDIPKIERFERRIVYPGVLRYKEVKKFPEIIEQFRSVISTIDFRKVW